ncbi:MAG: polysaccharide export protein [Pseudomonadota bacterium]|nr:polysaccharide export protein [Pseudomonadota bacterium]
MKSVLWAASLTSLALSLAACGGLPSSGPSATAVIDAGGGDAQTRPYELIDIDPSSIGVLGRRPKSSFAQKFGDHRASTEPVIGVGDMISVTIWEASSGGLFSSPAALEKLSAGANSATIPEQVVGRDGSITVPYAGRVKVAGHTTRAVQEVIQHALEGKAIQPQVLVNDSKPISNTVTIGGEGVSGAQRMPLSVKGDRLLDVIAQAGGVRMQVNEIFVLLQRGGVTERVPLARVTEDSRENIFMRPGDVVTLVRDPQTFLVAGASNANGELPFGNDTLTLAQALVKVGGVADYRADARGVFVFRYEQPSVLRALRPDSPLAHADGKVPVVYHVDLKDPNGLFMEQRFQIANRDLIFISNAPSIELEKAVAIFNGILTPVTSTAATAASTAVTLK